MDEAHPGTPLQGHKLNIGGDALSNTRISFRYKQETKTISEMDDKWPSMVAKSVSHPTVDDLGLLPNTPCNLRVVFVTHSAVMHSTAGHSSLPADADCESPSRPCPPAADSKAAAPLRSKPSLRFSVPQGTVAAAATPPSRRSPSPSYPLSFPPTVCLLFCRCCCCFRWIFVFSCSLLLLICN